jgi:hypothetical protein
MKRNAGVCLGEALQAGDILGSAAAMALQRGLGAVQTGKCMEQHLNAFFGRMRADIAEPNWALVGCAKSPVSRQFTVHAVNMAQSDRSNEGSGGPDTELLGQLACSARDVANTIGFRDCFHIGLAAQCISRSRFHGVARSGAENARLVCTLDRAVDGSAFP